MENQIRIYGNENKVADYDDDNEVRGKTQMMINWMATFGGKHRRNK